MAKIVSYWTGSEAGMISGGARVEAAELGGGEYYEEKLLDVGGAPDTPGVPCSELHQVKKAVLTRTTFKRELVQAQTLFLVVLSIICSRCHTVR